MSQRRATSRASVERTCDLMRFTAALRRFIAPSKRKTPTGREAHACTRGYTLALYIALSLSSAMPRATAFATLYIPFARDFVCQVRCTYLSDIFIFIFIFHIFFSQATKILHCHQLFCLRKKKKNSPPKSVVKKSLPANIKRPKLYNIFHRRAALFYVIFA